MSRFLLSHDFYGFNYIIPLERSERFSRVHHRVALFKVGFLFDGSNWIGFSGETFVNGVLEKTATNGKHLAHRASRHFVRYVIYIFTVLRSNLADLFIDLDVKRAPFVVDDVGVSFSSLTTSNPGKSRFDDRTDPLRTRL